MTTPIATSTADLLFMPSVRAQTVGRSAKATIVAVVLVMSRVRHELDPDPLKRFNGLVNIGVDETSYRKGYAYITSVVNHDTQEIVWIAKRHGSSVFSQFFEQITEEQRLE